MLRSYTAIALVAVLLTPSSARAQTPILSSYMKLGYTIVGYQVDFANRQHSVLLVGKDGSAVSCQLHGIAGSAIRTVGCARVD
jgi:hypothetical protein